MPGNHREPDVTTTVTTKEASMTAEQYAPEVTTHVPAWLTMCPRADGHNFAIATWRTRRVNICRHCGISLEAAMRMGAGDE